MFVFWIMFTVLVSTTPVSTRSIEPQCSAYDFFERTIEKVIRVEHASEVSKKEMQQYAEKIDVGFEKIGARIDTQDSKVHDFDAKIQDFDAKIQDFDAKIQTLERMEERVNKKIGESIGVLESQFLEIKDDLTTPTIVFKAKDAKVSHLSTGATIVFPTLVMNVGGGYDSSTGVFTAPTNGTYLFSVQVCLHADKYLYIRIVAADTVIAASRHEQDAHNAVCHKSDGVALLSQGDEVMVTMNSKSSGTVIWPDDNQNDYWTSFSGVLIHKYTGQLYYWTLFSGVLIHK